MCVRVCCCMSSSLHDVRRSCLGNRSRQHHNNVNQRGVAMRGMWHTHTHTHIHCWVFLWWHPRAVTEHTHWCLWVSVSSRINALPPQTSNIVMFSQSAVLQLFLHLRSCNTTRKNTISSFFFTVRVEIKEWHDSWKAKTLSDFSLPDLPLRSSSHTSLDSFQHL